MRCGASRLAWLPATFWTAAVIPSGPPTPRKLIFGIAGALFHLLIVVTVVVLVYNLIRAGASRRT